MTDIVPAISLILPVYNAEKFLSVAVRSMLDQTFESFELIAVDDGSIDGSLAILQRLAESDNRLRIISRPNTGYTVALNEAIGMARGPLIARMDADDISLPDRLMLQKAFMDTHPTVAAVGTWAQVITADGTETFVLRHPSDAASIRRALISDSAIVHPSVMMRTAVVRELGGYRNPWEPAEDYDLWVRISEKYDLANLPEILLQYRTHDNQVSATKAFQQVLARLGIAAAARKRRELGFDPVLPASRIDATTLLTWGIERREIVSSLYNVAVRKIDSLLTAHQPQKAEGVMRELESLLKPLERDRQTSAGLVWLWAKINRANGHNLRAFARMVIACVAEPSRIRRVIEATHRNISHLAKTRSKA